PHFKLFIALLACELYMLADLVIDSGLQAAAKRPLPILDALPVQAIFHAPAMTLVGAVVSARERLGKANEALQTKAREAQSRALQGQLHPHVLFNALNGLAELIHRNPPEAEESVRHLSSLLRKILIAAEASDFTLHDERELLEDYLTMESLRLGKRLRISWAWDPQVNPMQVPPLLLQPLVENALKHGIAPFRGGGELRIEARREDSQVVLAIWNTGAAFRPPSAPGGPSIGLRNLNARLELAFGSKAEFSLRPELGWTVAELRLPWNLSAQLEAIE
ncbi:MAG TPA: histidine kinase, partial [Holophagaceae bacterium]